MDIGHWQYSKKTIPVVWVAEAIGESIELDDGRRGMSLEDGSCGHVVVVESIPSEEGCGWALS